MIRDREILTMALIGLNAERERIDAMIESVHRELEGPGLPAVPANPGNQMMKPPLAFKKKRTLSAEGRAAIGAAARKRWAKIRRAKKAA